MEFGINKLFNGYRKIIGANKLFQNSNVNVQITGQNASDLIKDKLDSGAPLMISRFGGNELKCILNYYFINRSLAGNILNLIRGVPYFRYFRPDVLVDMNNGAGFFPSTPQNAKKFAQMAFDDIAEIDILGSWFSHERYLYDYMNVNHVRVHLEDLVSFNHPDPWSIALAGKKVLVIHPFEETIKNQYEKHTFLFENKNVLPAFKLTTYKSLQSIAGNDIGFTDWFAALEKMKSDITALDFDIAIIGCGAYGMPLAAHIKRMGKQAIHLGGVTQCLFGIKGKRWETLPYDYQDKFYNPYWVRPNSAETPPHASTVEDSCYW